MDIVNPAQDSGNFETYYHPFKEVLPEFKKIAYSVFDKAVRGLDEHDHGPCMELVVVETGQEIYHAEGKDYIVRGGYFFIAPAHLRHSTGVHPRSKHKHYCVLIDLGVNRPFLGNDHCEALRRSLSGLPALTARYEPELLKTLRRIYEIATHRPSKLQIIEVHNLFTRLLLDIVRDACKVQKEEDDFPLQEVIHYLENNIAKNLNVENMAEGLHMSASSFKKSFRAATGIAPAEYFLRMKLNKARYMIQCSDMPITEISQSLGFSTSQYFATVFKRYHLLSPMAWKREQEN